MKLGRMGRNYTTITLNVKGIKSWVDGGEIMQQLQ